MYSTYSGCYVSMIGERSKASLEGWTVVLPRMPVVSMYSSDFHPLKNINGSPIINNTGLRKLEMVFLVNLKNYHVRAETLMCMY